MSKKNSLLFFVLFYAFGCLASTLEVEWQHYTSSPSLKTQLDDYVFLKWDQKTDFHKEPFYFNSHIQAEYALDRSEIFYFNIPELYLLYNYQLEKPLYSVNSIELVVGRKIKSWSLADEHWNMGSWNSLSRWNPLHPWTNGLIGSFLTLNASRWTLDFFVGALHLPNQEAQIIRKNSEISSSSRWFSVLPDQVDMRNHNYIDIHYLIQSPFIFDVLFQQSYLLSFKTWSKTPETYYWMKWSIADKPVNHLFSVLNTTKLFKIGKEEGDKGKVHQTIAFLPVRQRLLSAEWGLDYNSYSAIFTVENTKMKEVDRSPAGWDFRNRRENFTYLSALLKYNFLPKSFVQVGYLQSWFQNYNVKAESSKKDKPPSVLKRYMLLEGISLECQTEFSSSKGLPRILALDYRRSFLNSGAWLFVKALYYITPEIYASLTFDILGSKKQDRDDFLDQFRHNDYFSWRLAYDF